MPYVTSFERLAKEEGREEGLKEGRKAGARTELLATIRALLKDKFGASGLRLSSKIQAVDDLSDLRKLALRIAKASSLQEIRDQLQ
jgi:hypothetical protein